MGKMYITLDDEIQDKFRKLVAKKYGLKKGNISKAVQEAIKKWIEENENE